MSTPSNGPSDTASGGTPRRRRNPLVWGIFVAIGALLPPWQLRDMSDLLMPAGGVVFLVLYFAKSRFAWHALAAHFLIIVPVYVFISPSWRLRRLLDLVRRMRVLVLLCSTAVLATHVLHAADVSDRPAQACAAPRVSQKSWRTVTARSCGIRLRLPPRYVEKRWAVTVGDFVGASYRAGHFDRIDITALRGADAQFGKVNRQSDYQGYSECAVEIGGHKATIQSFRGGGVIFDGGRTYPPFVVAATLELRPGYTLQFMCSASSRQSQEEILAILRTVEVLQ